MSVVSSLISLGLHIDRAYLCNGQLTLGASAGRRTARCPLPAVVPPDASIADTGAIPPTCPSMVCASPCACRCVVSSLSILDVRRTCPCADWLRHVAFSLGGEAGARRLRNYRDVALRVFKRHGREIDYLVAPGASRETLTRLRLDRQASRERTRTEMHERFGAIHQLASQGMNRSAIARYLGLHRHTVQKYLASEQPLERWHFCREVGRLTPYERYLLAHWRAGHRNAMQLWCEIVAQGSGSYRNVSRLTGYLRKCERDDAPAPMMPTAIISTQSAGILLARPEHRPTAEQMGRSGRCAASLPSSLRSSMRGSRSRACCATGPIRILQIGLRSGSRRRRGQVCRN